MDLITHFCQIRDFLETHEFLHSKEALNRIDESIPRPYRSWIDKIKLLSQTQKLDLENYLNYDGVDKEYTSFLAKIKTLSSLDNSNFFPKDIPQKLTRKLSLKKRHEISIIIEQIKNSQLKRYNHYFDIGSGAGHLSTVLTSEFKTHSTCIDMDEKLQIMGQEKIERYLPQIKDNISFKKVMVNKDTTFNFSSPSLFLGLHACGDLSTHIINSSITNKSALLNYGCCYHKITSEFENLSKVAKEKPIYFTHHAKTMAAKSYKLLTHKDDNKRLKVKRYRYALELYLKSHNSSHTFQSIGNAHKDDYNQDFSKYAIKYSDNIKTSGKELDEYYASIEVQDKIDDILCLGILRSHLARLIEIYIILDRALFLQENNKDVRVSETFSRDISPRNISLMAFEKLES